MADVITDLTDEDIRTEWTATDPIIAETDDEDAADADEDATDADEDATDADEDATDAEDADGTDA